LCLQFCVATDDFRLAETESRETARRRADDMKCCTTNVAVVKFRVKENPPIMRGCNFVSQCERDVEIVYEGRIAKGYDMI